MTTRWLRLFAAFLTLALITAGCGNDDDTTAADETTTDDAATDDEPTDDAPADGANRCEDVDLSQAPDEPVTIRFGHGVAAEEQVWLMAANPDITEHQGTWYELEPSQFRGNEERFVAYQAGELDALTAAAPTLVAAVSAGIDVQAVVSVSREAEEGEFRTTFVALEESGITEPGDLQGARVGIVDIGSATEYWARTGIEASGLSHETDVEYVVLPFPAQEEALRNGQIDVAVMVEPFYTMAQAQGGLVDVYDSLTGPGFDQELMTFAFDIGFRDANPEVVCAWIADFQSATTWYNENMDEAKQILVDEGFVQTPIEVYLEAGDWFRDDDATIDVEKLDDLINSMIEYGVFQEEQRIPAEDLVATEFAPTDQG
jgi:ABC-type nitrate/sulfonate/bicarbonate transport system substrate-binding protein